MYCDMIILILWALLNHSKDNIVVIDDCVYTKAEYTGLTTSLWPRSQVMGVQVYLLCIVCACLKYFRKKEIKEKYNVFFLNQDKTQFQSATYWLWDHNQLHQPAPLYGESQFR